MASGPDDHRHGRLLFIDNLRWSAIAMVVVIHAAVTYSGIGNWYVRDRLDTGRLATIGFATYQSLQHAVAMGLLFGIAGYFASRSLARHGVRGFLLERAGRLGLPLILYMFLVGPLTEFYVAGTWRSTPARTFPDEWLRHVGSGAILGGSGPLWFCLVLLVFSLCFAGLQLAWPRRPGHVEAPTPGLVTIAAYGLAMAAVTFGLGVLAPHAGTVLNVVVHDVPQYPFMFAAGVLAERNNWLLRFPPRYGPAGVAGGLVVGLVWWSAMLELGGAFRGELSAFGGGWHWQAASMDLWRSAVCLSLGIGLLTTYRDHVNRQGPVARFLTANAFGVYVFHPPVLIAITQSLRHVPVGGVVKFVVAGAASVVATFLFVGFVARRIPWVRAAL